MNELLLIRHGESKYNAMLTDNLDSELTAKGIKQAHATGKFLKETFGEMDFIGITSPYLRCLQTSQIIAEETGLKFKVIPDPREIMVSYEQAIVPARQEEFPEFIWNLPCSSSHWKDDKWHFFKESADEFVNRMEKFMMFLNYEKSIIVSHGTPVGTMYDIRIRKPGSYRSHRPDTENYVNNASVTYVRDGEGIWYGKNIPDS